ncbi:FGGY-family carbohydrate kinase [uncultured Roseibium sp.]|uniref:FGGY-family carbohydrate kinase n=1 Tax=uncultured Roseibium sp. TaxID=1936171 RepID=UPI00260FE4BC|nr:FGGY-family carbohydrate kinase [uncultured Roseibium sp.]
MSEKDLIIGIDAGTSVIKAVAFDLSGHQIALASRRNEYTSLANGGVEQDMNRTWRDTVAVLGQLVDSVPECASRCAAVAVTGQGDGTWLIDRNGEPVHDGWLWLDARAAETSRHLAEGAECHVIYQRTATGINVCQMRTHLCWMRDNAPDLIKRASTAFHCKDWLYFKLTGVRASDISEGVFTFGDYRTRTYSPEVIDALGLADHKELLPPIIDGSVVSHGLSDEAAKACGLTEGTPICLGLVDVMCSALGAGLYDPAAAPGLTILGSTGMHMRFVPDAEAVVLNDAQCGYTMPFPGGAFAQMQTNMAATLNIDWALGIACQICATQNMRVEPEMFLAAIDDLVIGARPDSAFYHPYISSAGERGPFTNPDARASWTGLDQGTTWADMLRAVFDGLILAARDCYETMGNIPGEIRLTGGAAKSKAFRTLLAAGLGAPVRTIAQPEAGAAGAAMIAAVQQGLFEDVASAVDVWVTPHLNGAELPDEELMPLYNGLFDTYLETRRALPHVWSSQSKARRELS